MIQPLEQRIYTIIGDGRAARHMMHYLTLLNIPFYQWSRKKNNDLERCVMASQRILLLISDAALTPFLHQYPILSNKMVIHFSGALNIQNAYTAHPLTSFSEELFDLERYQKIPFFLEIGSPDLTELLPGLSNPQFCIPAELKSLYHSLCVISGNFTTLLWQKFFKELEQTFNVPKEAALPYLEIITRNLQINHQNALTGPLARGDFITMQKNLEALGNDPIAKIYRAFIEVYVGGKHDN